MEMSLESQHLFEDYNHNLIAWMNNLGIRLASLSSPVVYSCTQIALTRRQGDFELKSPQSLVTRGTKDYEHNSPQPLAYKRDHIYTQAQKTTNTSLHNH